MTGFKDMAVVGKPIEEGCGHFGIAENAIPLTEAEFGGDVPAFKMFRCWPIICVNTLAPPVSAALP